jgi:hypothetical protein
MSITRHSTSRWFDTINGVSQRSPTVEPTGVVEYVIPSGWLGGRDAGAAQSRPRLPRWGGEKLVECIGAPLYPMGRWPRLQDGVAPLDRGVGLWIEEAGLCSRDCCTFSSSRCAPHLQVSCRLGLWKRRLPHPQSSPTEFGSCKHGQSRAPDTAAIEGLPIRAIGGTTPLKG